MGKALAFFTGMGTGYLNASRQKELDAERRQDRADRAEERAMRMEEANRIKQDQLSLADAAAVREAVPGTAVTDGGGNRNFYRDPAQAQAFADDARIEAEMRGQDQANVSLAPATGVTGKMSLGHQITSGPADVAALNAPQARQQRIGLAYEQRGNPLAAEQYRAAGTANRLQTAQAKQVEQQVDETEGAKQAFTKGFGGGTGPGLANVATAGQPVAQQIAQQPTASMTQPGQPSQPPVAAQPGQPVQPFQPDKSLAAVRDHVVDPQIIQNRRVLAGLENQANFYAQKGNVAKYKETWLQGAALRAEIRDRVFEQADLKFRQTGDPLVYAREIYPLVNDGREFVSGESGVDKDGKPVLRIVSRASDSGKETDTVMALDKFMDFVAFARDKKAVLSKEAERAKKVFETNEAIRQSDAKEDTEQKNRLSLEEVKHGHAAKLKGAPGYGDSNFTLGEGQKRFKTGKDGKPVEVAAGGDKAANEPKDFNDALKALAAAGMSGSKRDFMSNAYNPDGLTMKALERVNSIRKAKGLTFAQAAAEVRIEMETLGLIDKAIKQK